jgi:alpha-N-acetylgalactosaminidase
MIDRIAGDGWLEAGYDHVNIDDCWSSFDRDENRELQGDPTRFPHGIAWLANYAHSKGVKLGIYNDYGSKTCAGYPGSAGHLRVDALTFARWGIDMLKMDGCNSQIHDMADGYPLMAEYLNATGRPIIYSCSWPAYNPDLDYSLLPPVCNLWRNWYDIGCNWGSIKSTIDQWGNSKEWIKYAGPGHWNDPDQLMIGMQPNEWVYTITAAEARTQISLWSILAAPLIMSNDLRNISATAKEILQNKEIIAVDQDLLGIQGERITEWGNDATVWVKPLKDGGWAIALWNRGEGVRDIVATFGQFAKTGAFAVRDLWTHKELGTFKGEYRALAVPEHDTVMLRLTPI